MLGAKVTFTFPDEEERKRRESDKKRTALRDMNEVLRFATLGFFGEDDRQDALDSIADIARACIERWRARDYCTDNYGVKLSGNSAPRQTTNGQEIIP